jgi:hypothetical protein
VTAEENAGLNGRRWWNEAAAALLRRNGRLILIEGYWSTGGGLRAPEVVAALPSAMVMITVETLVDRPVLWGKQVGDERYAVIADLP